jgi:uncharacterized phage protein gp47/JayE
MTSTQANAIYRTEAQLVQDLAAAWAVRIPDINVGPDSVVTVFNQVFGKVGSGFFLGLQLLHNDLFIQSMSALALQREGAEIGRPQKAGTLATGTVRLAGAGGTFVPSGSQVGAPRPTLGDTLVFETTEDVTIPDPGTPAAPTAADASTSGNLTGTIEYAITFTTSLGETAIGAPSLPLVLTASQATLSAIPAGGPGTTGRSIYRRNNGGDWLFVHHLADNTTASYTDNVADGALAGSPPETSTAEQVLVSAQAISSGAEYDVVAGTITSLVQVDGDVTGVTNDASFSGGTDPEDIEAFRQELLKWKQNPQSGSPNDLVSWATSIEGVDSAAVFKNVNLSGTTEVGSVVVRISGPDSTIPDSDTIDAVQAFLDSKVLANITVYVGTFTPLSVVPHLTVTPDSGYVLADVSTSVQESVAAYVNSVPPGGTVYVAGIYHAAFQLPGVATIAVTLPASDVTAAADEKPAVDPADVVVS